MPDSDALTMDEPFLDNLGDEYGFYGNTPLQITEVEILK